VVAAEDGQAGIDLARVSAFDLAIVDMFMPGLDGIQTIAQIRQFAPAMPIIAVSGAGGRGYAGSSSDVLTGAPDVGANLIINKPFRPREMLQAIAKCLASGGNSPAT